MKIIDLDNIIREKKLGKKELAQNLFPGNKHASLALNRVIKGDGFLDSNQISLLSELTGISIGNLYTRDGWKTESKSGLMIFTSNDYRAELDTVKWSTKVFCKGSLFHEEVIHTHSISLSTYLEKLSLVVGSHLEK
jgi:hypothetical protein